jgi:hypothetical protein
MKVGLVGNQVENSHNVLEAQDIPALVIWRTEDQIIPAAFLNQVFLPGSLSCFKNSQQIPRYCFSGDS